MNVLLTIIVGGICALIGMPTVSPAANGQRVTFSTIEELQTPAEIGSREPNLVVSADGQVLLSWLEPVESSRFALRFARLESRAWS